MKNARLCTSYETMKDKNVIKCKYTELMYVCDRKLYTIIQKYEIFLEHQIYTQSDS